MVGTCVNCGANLSPSSTSCPSCGSPRRSPSTPKASGGGFCGSCGTTLASKFAPCPKCGHVKTTFSPPGLPPLGGKYKSSGTTLLLAILPAIFLATCGIGHIYLGKIGKGIGTMIGGWAMLGICIASSYWLNFMNRNLFSYQYKQNEQALLILGIISIGFAIGYIVLLIWSIINANRTRNMYNEFLNQNGRAPW